MQQISVNWMAFMHLFSGNFLEPVTYSSVGFRINIFCSNLMRSHAAKYYWNGNYYILDMFIERMQIAH